MHYDTLTIDQTVDAEAALEFMKEATKLATTTQLDDVGDRLAEKGRRFAGLLAPGRIGDLDEAALAHLTGSIFSLRRKAGRLVRANGLARLRDGLADLLYGEAPLAARFDRFVGAVEGVERGMAVALASECLHFADPGRFWLWTHWIWNPNRGTGALALVTQQEANLGAAGDSDGEVYEKVGRAMALVDAQGHAVGYSRSGRGLYGTDVFLASVYAVYMYTVFRVKLSQEFNRILPELPELVERVLGVHRREKSLEPDD